MLDTDTLKSHFSGLFLFHLKPSNIPLKFYFPRNSDCSEPFHIFCVKEFWCAFTKMWLMFNMWKLTCTQLWLLNWVFLKLMYLSYWTQVYIIKVK